MPYFAAAQTNDSTVFYNYEDLSTQLKAEIDSITSAQYLNDIKTEGENFKKEKEKFDGYGLVIIFGLILFFLGFCIWAWRYKKTYVEKNTVNGIYVGAGSAYFRSRYGDDSGDSSVTDVDWYSGDDYSGGGASDSW
jgi:hypothetical protein